MNFIQIIILLTYSKTLFCHDQMRYQAGLIIDGANFCSGALIHENYVVTTAHCLNKAFIVDVILGVNKNLLEINVTSFISTTFILHEKFNENDYNHDIALVKIPGAPNYLTILHVSHFVIPNGAEFKLVRFNVKQDGEISSQSVQISDSACQQESCKQENIFSAILTVCDSDDGDTNDERGSPIVDKDGTELVGITINRNKSNILALNIKHFYDWILANVH